MANTVKLEDLEKMADLAHKQEAVFWEKEMVVSYKLTNGFTVLGRAACVDPTNFNADIGRKLCRDDVIRQLWALEGYLLQVRLAESNNNDRYLG